MKNIELQPGYVYDMTPSKVREKEISECISINALEEGYILNGDGSIAVGFEASLFEEEFLDESGFRDVINTFSTALKTLPFGTVVQKLDIYHAEPFDILIEEDTRFIKRKTLESLQGQKFLRHTSFIYIRFFPNPRKINPVLAPLARFNQTFQDSFVDFDSKKRKINTCINEFLGFLPQGMKLRRLSDEENRKMLYKFSSLAFDREPICFDSAMVVQEEQLAVNGYLKSVRIKKQPDKASYSLKDIQGVTSGFLYPITHFANFPHVISQQIEIINDKKFLKGKSNDFQLASWLMLIKKSREKAQDKYEDFIEYEKDIEKRGDQIVKFSTHVFVWHAEKEVLNERVIYIKDAFSKVGIDSEEEFEKTGASFFSSFPGGCGFFEGMHMPMETAVAHLNFVRPRKGEEENKKEPLLRDRHGSPIFYNSFNENLDNQHAFVFGPSGSGKSFFNGKMIMDRYDAGHTVIVIDSGGTYRNLFKALAGKYIEYDPEKPLALNPFLVPKEEGKYKADALKRNFLVSFIAKIWKKNLNENPLSPDEDAVLFKALKFYYNDLKEGQIPTLSGFCSYVPLYMEKEKINPRFLDIESFLNVLEEFTSGEFKDLFNAREEVKIENERLICFELKAIKEDPKIYPLVVNVLFDYVFQIVDKQPDQKKFIDVEEGWAMLDDVSKGYIEAFFRQGRKTGTSIRIITQSIKEIKNSAIAGAMRDNAATRILLHNDSPDIRNEIADFLGLNEFDREKYASLTRKNSYIDGFREVLIKEADQSNIWRVQLSLHEHAILTSRNIERNYINKLIEKRGSVELGVSQWVREMLEKEGKGN